MKKIDEKFVWEEFSEAEIETKHDIKAVAKRDGLGDEPSTDSTGSALEGEIKQDCDSYISKNKDNLRIYLDEIESSQNKLSSHLKQNHFEKIVNKLDSDYHAAAHEEEIKIIDLHNNFKTYEEEQKQFSRYHQISREPNYATISKTIKAFGLIAFLFVLEVTLNGFMLQGALVGGIAEGIAVATSVAFLNVITSGLFGYHIFKNLTHLEKGKKILYGFFASIYTVFLIYINACLGAYRSESQKVFDSLYNEGDAAAKLSPSEIQEIFSNIITPWSGNIDYIFVGIILTFVGLTFAFIAVMDGFTYNDTYPGYGNVGKKVNDYKDKIRKTKTLYAKEDSKLFAYYKNELQNSYDKILENELNYWDANTNLIQKEFTTYRQKVDRAERGSKHVIIEYREENKRVRKTEPPQFFNKAFSIPEEVKDPKKVFPDVAFHYMSDEQREEKKLQFSENIDQKFKQAEKEVEVLQEQSTNKQKEINEKYNTH